MDLTDAHYRGLVEAIDDCAICYLDVEGVVQTWNRGAELVVGHPARDILGTSIARVYTEADRAAGLLGCQLATARECGRHEDTGWRVRADGTQFWAAISITAVRDDRGAVIGFAKRMRDVSDRAFRQFVEGINGIVWTTHAHGRPNADSPTWRAFTGQTEEEWRGEGGWTPVHPDDIAPMRVGWPRARAEKQPFVAEFRLRRHDGVYIWHGCRAIPLLYPDGEVREWIGVTFDIAARKEAEEARLRAERWWSTTLHSIGDGVIATDARGHVTFVNAVAARLTGWSFAEARGRPLSEIFAIVNEDTRAPVADPVAQVLELGAVVGLANHTLLIRRDGSEVAIDDSAAPIRGPSGELDGVVLVFRDASAEKLETARRAFLARAGDELGQAADHRQVLALVARLAVPRLADWCAVELVELTTGEIQRVAIEHVDPIKAAAARRFAAEHPHVPDAPRGPPSVIRTGKPSLVPEVPREVVERHAYNTEHQQMIAEIRSAMIVPLHGRDRTLGALTFLYTGRRRYTEDDLAFAEELARRVAIVVERRRLEEDALAASRAKDEFLALLGHELRNPLAPILTAVQLIKLRGAPANRFEHEVIERQVSHLVRLVDDLLDVSRITRGKVELALEPLALAGVIAQALEMASPLIEQRGHRVTVDVPDTIATHGDPYRLGQVFANLVNNAAKYTPPGGTIAIAAVRDGDDVVVTVADSGVGIAPDVLPQVFELFVQEKQGIDRAHGGLGIGLSIVKNLVDRHGGSVTAESAGHGLGSAFHVRLPALAHTPIAAPVEERPPAPPSERYRLLVVDDNVDGAMMLQAMLEGLGYEICVAYDGAQALAAAPAFRPHLALLDIGLPVMDGYELAGRLRELLAEAPPQLVAVTGYGRDQDRERGREAGFHRHLGKPVTIGLLQQTLDELLPRAGDRQ